MNEVNMQNIKNNYMELVQLNVTDSFLGEFQGILALDKINLLKGISDRTNKARHFWIELLRSPDSAYLTLIKALNKTGQINFISLLDPNNTILEETVPQVHNSPNNISGAKHIISKWQKPAEVCVKLSTNFDHNEQRNQDIQVYKTRSINRGLVKIININKFQSESERKGSVNDVNSLKNLFRQIGMVVDCNLKDLTAQEIRDEIDAFVTNDYLRLADIAILVIMTHGHKDPNGKEYIIGFDEKFVYTEEILSSFCNRKCVLMQNKPKILIFQSCRGPLFDSGVARVQQDTAPSTPIMPALSDVLLIHSSLPNFESHRDKIVGSWYIQLMCQVFMEHSHNTHIEDMCKITQKRLNMQVSDYNTIQTSEIHNIAFKICYLNPGIYMEDGVIKNFL